MSGTDGPNVQVMHRDHEIDDEPFDEWDDIDWEDDIDDEPDHTHEDEHYNGEVEAAYKEKVAKKHIFNIEDLDL